MGDLDRETIGRSGMLGLLGLPSDLAMLASLGQILLHTTTVMRSVTSHNSIHWRNIKECGNTPNRTPQCY